MSKEISVIERIKNNLNNSPLLEEALGKNKEKYILSVLSEINKTAGDDYKDLTKCELPSIITAIKSACDLNLEIDSRQHCHLVKFGNKCTLQVGYRGYIYSIKRFYPDANIDCRLVYDGDNFSIKKEGDITTYTLEPVNPFAKKDKIIGGFCYISYTLGDRLVSFCETVGIDEINRIKGVAKTKTIWDAWFEEKAKVAIIKRACKIHFSGIQEIAQITDFDNQDYNFEEMKEAKVVEETIDMEQGLELEELAKKAGKKLETICKIHNIDTIIQLPLSKFETVKANLGSVNASA